LQVETVSQNVYRVNLQNMAERSSAMEVVADMFAFAKKAPLARSRNASRGQTILPPGENATWLSGYPISFFWCGDQPPVLKVRDEKGKEVFNSPIVSTGNSALNTQGLELNYDQKYFWSLDAGKHSSMGVIQPTSAEDEKAIIGVLEEIARSENTPEDRALKQSVFLLSAPEIYDENLDYRWLVFALLRDLEFPDTNAKALAAGLLKETDFGLCTE